MATSAKKSGSGQSYVSLILEALSSLKQRGGSSRQAIKKWIEANKAITARPSTLRQAFRTGVKKAKFTQKGQTFKLADNIKQKAKKSKQGTKNKVKKQPALKQAPLPLSGDQPAQAKSPKTKKAKPVKPAKASAKSTKAEMPAKKVKAPAANKAKGNNKAVSDNTNNNKPNNKKAKTKQAKAKTATPIQA